MTSNNSHQTKQPHLHAGTTRVQTGFFILFLITFSSCNARHSQSESLALQDKTAKAPSKKLEKIAEMSEVEGTVKIQLDKKLEDVKIYARFFFKTRQEKLISFENTDISVSDDILVEFSGIVVDGNQAVSYAYSCKNPDNNLIVPAISAGTEFVVWLYKIENEEKKLIYPNPLSLKVK